MKMLIREFNKFYFLTCVYVACKNTLFLLFDFTTDIYIYFNEK